MGVGWVQGEDGKTLWGDPSMHTFLYLYVYVCCIDIYVFRTHLRSDLKNEKNKNKRCNKV